MIVYHGSKSLFDKFDYSRIGENGTTEGKGFYFSDKIEIAKGYGDNGYLYTVEFSGKKSLSSDSLTITPEQLAKYLIELHRKTDYLSNWGEVEYEGMDKVLKRAIESEYKYADNDVDLIGGIVNASGNIETSLTLLYELLGYDSIIVDAEWGGEQRLYIALTNDIIKILDVQKLG